MALNRTEQAIIWEKENVGLETRAAEMARRNEQGFKYGWTAEQHLSSLEEKYISLKAQEAAEAQKFQKKASPSAPATKRPLMNYTEQVLAGIDTGE